MTPWTEVRAGMRAIAPLLPSLIPFGIITGVTAIEAGIPFLLAVSMSSIMYAGAAQLAAITLIESNTPATIIVATAIIINLRFAIYSTSFAPHLQALTTRLRLLCGYLLSDHSYAATIPHLESPHDTEMNTLWFYLGAAVPPWIVWQVTTLMGAAFGTSVPRTFSLEFTIPLAFIGILSTVVEDQSTAISAAGAGIAGLFASALPYNLGLILAILLGVTAGVTIENRRTPIQEACPE